MPKEGYWEVPPGGRVSADEFIDHVEDAEAESPHGKGGGGGEKPKKGERTFGHGKKAAKKRRTVDVDQSREGRAEEVGTILEKHLQAAIPRKQEREERLEAYLDWLLVVLDNADYVMGDQEVEISRSTPTGPGGSGKDTSNTASRAIHIPTREMVRIQEQRSEIENRKIALEVLAENVSEWADRWRKYEKEKGEGSALDLFNRVTGYE